MIVVFVVGQVSVAFAVVMFLKNKLRVELIEAALENLQSNISSQTKGEVVVISAQELDPIIRGRIENIVKRKSDGAILRFETDASLKSGLIIHAGEITLDFSLANRMKSLKS